MMSLKVKKLEMQKFKEDVEYRKTGKKPSRDQSRDDDARSKARTTASHRTRPTSILKNGDKRPRDKTPRKESNSVLQSFKNLIGNGDESSKKDESVSRHTNRDSRTAKVSIRK